MRTSSSPSSATATGTTAAATGSRRRRWRNLGILGGVIAAMLLGALSPWAGAAPPAAFRWSMPERFGIDANGDHVVDERTDPAYVDPSSWPVDFDACQPDGQPHPGANYRWDFGDGSPPTAPSGACKATHPYAEIDRPYQVTLTVADGSGSNTTTQTILPRDHVVVALGDSAASGEGNPDHLEPALRSRSFDSAGFSHDWNDEQCHRSALAGPAQAAIRMEQRDPHSSVTFIHLACSGARITRGIIAPYQGLINEAHPRLDCDDPDSPFYIRYPDPKFDQPNPTAPGCLPSQVQQLETVIGGRRIDAVTVSGGINDVFFSKVAFACLLTADCSTMPSDQMMGPDGQPQTAQQFLGARFGQLQSRFAALADELMELPLRAADPAAGVAAGRVFFTTYPDLETDDDGSICHTDELARVLPPWIKDDVEELLSPAGLDPTAGVMTQGEWGWAAQAIVGQLKNHIVQATAAANAEYPGRFEAITEVTGAFATHGYCANDTWARDIPTSFLYQRDPEGSFHPNRAGHFYGYALPMEDHLAAHLGITAPELPPHVPGDIEAFEAINQDLAQFLQVLSRIDFVEELEKLLPDDTRKKREKDDDRDLDLARLPQLIRDAVGGLRDEVVAEGTPKALSELDAWLDTLDAEVGPLQLDVEGRITPHAATERYELHLDLTLDGPLTEMRLDAGGLRLDGPDVDAEVAMSFRFIVEPDRGRDRMYLLPADDNGVRVTLKANQTVPPGEPRDALLGVVDVAVHGPATGPAVLLDSSIEILPKDPNGNGEISVDELVGRAFSGAFDVDCVTGSRLLLDLHLRAGLPGLTGEIAALAVDDTNLCDGLDTPTVDFADPDLSAVENLGATDVVDTIIAVAQALEVIQSRSDVDLPFGDGALSDVVDVAGKVRRFLVDAGWTDPDDPLTPLPLDEAEQRSVSLADLVSGLEDALELPAGTFDLRYEPAQHRFALDLGFTADVDGATVPADAALLDRVGIVDAAAAATVAVDATATVDLGVALDVTPDPDGTPTEDLRTVTDRLLVRTDGAGITVDADARLRLDADARIGPLPVTVTVDDGAGGPRPLLARNDPAQPMLRVGLTSPGTHASLADLLSGDPDRFGVTADVNVGLPATPVAVVARLSEHGPVFGTGSVTVSWPDLGELSGPNGPQVVADAAFARDLLRFADAANDPWQMVALVLGGVRDAADGVVATARENEELARSLPVVGAGYDDIVAAFDGVSVAADRLLAAHEQLTIPNLEAALEAALVEHLGLSAADAAQAAAIELDRSTPRTALVLHLDLCAAADATPGCGDGPDVDGRLTVDADGLGLVGVDGDATFGLDYLARLRIDVAVELPAVVAGTADDPTPTVAPNEAPMGVFLLGSTGVSIDLSADVDLNRSPSGAFRVHVGPYEGSLGIRGQRNGSAFSEPATGAVQVRLAVGTGQPAAERLTLGEWFDAVAGDVADGIVDPTAPNAGCPGAAALDACLTLPVYVRSAAGAVTTADGRKWERMGTGSVTFTAADLLDPATWDANVPQDVQDALVDRALSVTSLIEGIRALLAEAKAAMDGAASGQQIPVVGEALDAGSAAVEKLDQAAAQLETLAAAVESKTTAGAVRSAISGFLTSKLGPTGVGILSGTPEVVATCGTATCADSASIFDVTDVAVRFTLGRTAQAVAPTVDSGIPGLAVGTDAAGSGTVSWQLDVAVGVDGDGFYLNPTNRVGRPSELTVDATVAVPASFDGTLAGLPVRLTEPTEGPNLALQLGADLLGTDRIRLAELVGRGADILDRDSIRLSAQGCADLDLGFDVRLPVTSDEPTALPGLLGRIDVHADWNGCPGSTGAPVDIRDGLAPVASAAIRDVRLDAGQTVSDLVGPVLGNLQHLTMPLQPVVDKVTSPIPVVSDLARLAGREQVTWLDAFEAQQAASGNDVTGLTTIVRLVDYVNGFDAAGQPTVQIPVVNDLDIDIAAAGRRYADPEEAIDQLIANTPVVNDVMTDLEAAGWTVQTEIDQVAPTEGGAEFRFPVVEEPTLLLQLIFGKDVDLAVFDAGPLFADAPFDYSYGLPFAKIGIRGTAEVRGHFAVSYDTAGVRRLAAERPLTLSSMGALVHGLGVNDLDRSGEDVPEVRLDANVTAYAFAGVPGFNVEARGGVRGYAQANLRDPDGDGKLRYEEIRDVIADPLCLFDLDGRVEAFLEVSGRIGFLRGTRQIVPPYALLEFANGTEGGCGIIGGGDPEDPTPGGTELELARQRGAGLDLNVGLAADLLDGELENPDDPADRAEHVTVIDHGDGSVTVVLGAARKSYGSPSTPISELFANFGVGDDTFEMVRDPDPAGTRAPVIAHVQMGTGNDTVIGGPAADGISGQEGNDMLRGGDGNDVINGQDGNDLLFGDGGHEQGLNGGAGDDYIEGGDGGDTIRPMDGRDIAFGGPGNDSIIGDTFGAAPVATGPDVLDGGEGRDALVGSAQGDLLIGGLDAQLTNSPDDHMMGRGGDDCLVGDTGVAPDLAELQGPVCLGLTSLGGPGGADSGYGEAGNDTVVTGGGYSESLLGGDGDDHLDGGPGLNQIKGDNGHDTLISYEGNDTLEGGAGNDTLAGGEGADSISGLAGDDSIYAEGGNDSNVYGGDGNDTLDGGPGTDSLRAGNGNDVLVGDLGNDLLVGEVGDDTLEGDAGIDNLNGDSTTIAGTTTDGHDVVDGGPDNDNLVLGRGDDVADGGAGNDTADAGPGNDVVAGGPGSDRLHGKAGDDTVDGGPGNDAIVGDVTRLDEYNPPVVWPNGALRLLPTYDLTVAGTDVLIGGGGEDFAYDTELTPPSATTTSGITVTITDPADHGTTGTVATSFSYRPATGYQGSDSVGFRLNRSTTGAVFGNGRAVVSYLTNRAPTAADDRVSTPQGRPVAGDVLANDTDPDADPLAATPQDAATGHGHVVLAADGTFTYTPDPTFAGTDGFDYTVADPRGESDTAHVTVTVRPDVAGPGVDCAEPSGAWSAREVTIPCVATDGGAGLADPDQASFELVTVMGVGLEGPYPLDPPSVCDRAGNCTDLAPFDVLVDRKGPTVTSATDGMTFPAGTKEILAEVECTDGGSGVAFEGCPDHHRSLDVSPGEHTFEATGRDRVGNTTTRTFRYSVASEELRMVSIGDASVVEGDDGTRRLYVPVTLDRASDVPVSVWTNVAAMTATLRRDVRGLAASEVRFEVDRDTGLTPVVRFITLEVRPDDVDEGDETLQLTLSDPSGAIVTRAAGIATIVDDDPSLIGIRASVGDVTVVEGDKDEREVRVTVSLSQPSTRMVSLMAFVEPVTADADDVALSAEVVTFAPGEVSRTVTVLVKPDDLEEVDESARVRLVSDSVPLARRIGKVTILEDDPSPA